jgi:hypothetical protein
VFSYCFVFCRHVWVKRVPTSKKWRLIGMQAYVNCSVGQSRGRLVMSTAKNEFAINAVSRGLRVSLSSAIYTFA